MKTTEQVFIIFNNLTGSVRLIVPFNKRENIQYGHIKNYMIHTSNKEILDILLEVGTQIEERIDASRTLDFHIPLYLSTHGDGYHGFIFVLKKFQNIIVTNLIFVFNSYNILLPTKIILLARHNSISFDHGTIQNRKYHYNY